MEKRQMRENVKALALILESYAERDTPEYPDAKACVRLFAKEAETNPVEQTLEIVNALHDGLSYGNWPWVVAKLNLSSK